MFPVIFYLITLATNPSHELALGASSVELASRTFSMEKRYDNDFVNGVFRDNILLTIHYMSGAITARDQISWDNVNRPFEQEFTLQPGEEFAFHDQVLPQYDKNVVKTTNAHFNSSDGFKSDGYLMGDGVCHLASFMYWVAKDAGLDTTSLVRHDFAKINEVPREYGVSIKYMPGALDNSGRQNLYITNNQDKPVTFKFNYDGANLSVSVSKAN